MLTYCKEYRQANERDEDAPDGKQRGLRAGKEELAYDHIKAAQDRKDRDHGVKRHLVFALKFRMRAPELHHAGKRQGVENPAGECAKVSHHVKLPGKRVDAAEQAD